MIFTHCSRCRSCGRTIAWVRMVVTGKLAPIDPIPVWDGSVLLCEDGQTACVPRKAEWRALLGDGGPETVAIQQRRFRSHFASCPGAARHRRA